MPSMSTDDATWIKEYGFFWNFTILSTINKQLNRAQNFTMIWYYMQTKVTLVDNLKELFLAPKWEIFIPNWAKKLVHPFHRILIKDFSKIFKLILDNISSQR